MKNSGLLLKRIMANLRVNAHLISKYCIIALLILLPSVAHATWTIQGVDTPNNFSDMSSRSIAIDSAGHPHIAYGGDHLYHAYHNGVQWIIETVDASPGVGKYASIAIDSNGKIHISYWDETNEDLKYATNTLGIWVTITIDTANVGSGSSIALDSSNKVHISYFDWLHYDLKYATNVSGSWVTTTVDSAGAVGFDPSIAIDSNNKVHISYLDATNYDLKYATNALGSWVTTTVDSYGIVGAFSSIALDSGGKAYISYYDGTNGDLKYAANASGSWVTTTIDSGGIVGNYSSIVVDSSNKTHISYFDYTNGDLKYVTNTSGSWGSPVIVDVTGGVGQYTSIAVDGNNKAHISYYDFRNDDLKYITNSSGIWVATTIDSTGDVGKYSSIAVDSNNKVHVSYYDATNGNLKYATNASGSWMTTTIDANSWDTAGYTSIAIDSNNKVHISYYDSTNNDLGYATNAFGSWTISWPDSAGDVGNYSSIAVDSNGKAYISYYDQTNYELKYVTNASSSWIRTTVDSTGSVGMYTSIAIDSNSKVHISYYDSTNGNLKYASNYPGSWYIETIDHAGYFEVYSSIAVDSNNSVHISYFDEIDEDLEYATKASGNWVITTVDSAGAVGKYASIAMDISDKAHIGYYDSTNSDLKYATNAPIDTTPPVGSISINSDAVYSNSATVALILTCDDLQGTCSQMQFSNDGASWSTPGPYFDSWASWDITSSTYGGTSYDGLKYVYVRFKDSSGNWTAPYSDTITLDATPPTGTIIINSGAASTNTPDVTLSLTCNDGTGSGCYQMRFRNDVMSESFESGLPSGWTVTENAGSEAVWRFDDPGSRGNNTGGTGNFAIADSDNAGSVNMDTELRTSPMDLSNLSNVILGFKTDFYSYSGSEVADVDVSVNGSAGPWTNVWRKTGADYHGPKTEVVDITSITAGQNNVMVRFHYYNANYDWWWQIDDIVILSVSSWSNPESVGQTKSWVLSNGDGVKTVFAQYSDIAGNWSDVITDTITLDTTPPNAPSVDGSALTNNTTPTWTWNSGGGGGAGTFRYKIDDSDLTAGATETTSLSYTPGSALTEGVHTLYVQERDSLYNWSVSGSFTVTIDTTAPNSPSVTGTTLTSNKRPTWTWYSGGNGGTGNYRYKLDDSNLTTGATTTTSTSYTPGSDLTDGSHTLYVQERDTVTQPGNNWSIALSIYYCMAPSLVEFWPSPSPVKPRRK